MRVYQLTVGPIQEHPYFIVKDNKDTLIIDPGDQAETIEELIAENQLNPVAILLTHAHFDHIGAVEDIRERYNIDVWQHIIEADWLKDKQTRIPKTRTRYWNKMGQHSIAGFTFKTAHVPGHSPGSVVYIFEEDGFVVAGDTLFKGTIGRTDLDHGDQDALISGIKRHLLTLPDETQVLPGHGGITTIGQEKATNPFLQGNL
ncbi:MBL fold metallo-hydrolase [Aerococcus viridans]|uniref:MBL fold metallo-hydrolase n=1 Tax=Aerococcus viridans TaxID=1377 RepID=A0A2J9PLQ9_9LACT|nr:MBL fold metallo-hydrolase [Aerococcus viridans]MCT1798672.1 MBL fold metallo-hydrolase [Aerococcus viridans]PNL91275.1 MBL fold metallo-hydrolase [Aerococcus viridans]